ncbi:MAG: hypothetical protein Q4P32_10415 [Micrococcales bacterium]|nr:hypothetical protein [Micrococcales bacterium]
MRTVNHGVAVGALAICLALSACSITPDERADASGTAAAPDAGGQSVDTDQTSTPTPTQRELPRGGKTLFPTYRLVGYSGIIGSGPGLGRAGVGNVDERMTELLERAKPYAADGRKIMPTLEYIATMVHPCNAAPKCRTRSTDERIQEHLDAVRKVNGILLLAIQPGRSDFPTEVKAYEKFLKEPDVGVALDPEWRMGPTQVPMKSFGSTSGKELNDTAKYLSGLVQANHLPDKVMLYHMIRINWVRQPQDLKPAPGVTQIVSVDGIGSKAMKTETWNAIMKVKPKHVHPGFKMFYSEDTVGAWKLMTPTEVMALKPTPEYVLYE